MTRTIPVVAALLSCIALSPACSKKKQSSTNSGSGSGGGSAAAAGTTSGSAAKRAVLVCGSTKVCKQRGLCVPSNGRCIATDESCRASVQCKYFGFCAADVDQCARFGVPMCRAGADEYCKRTCGDGCRCKYGKCVHSTTPAKPLPFPDKMSRRAIQQVVKLYASSTRACYERRLLRDANLGGKLVVAFTITPAGAPSDVKIASSSFSDASLGACVARVVRAMHFPQPAKPKQVKYPFVFATTGMLGKLQISIGGKPLLRLDAAGVLHYGDMRLLQLMVAEKEIWGMQGKLRLRADGSVVKDGKPLAGDAKIDADGKLTLAGKVLQLGADGKVTGGDGKGPCRPSRSASFARVSRAGTERGGLSRCEGPAVVIKGATKPLLKRAAMLLYVHNVLPLLGGKKPGKPAKKAGKTK